MSVQYLTGRTYAGRPVFLLHVTGQSPHAFDHWALYRRLVDAKAQATNNTHDWRGELRGDFVATIYRLDGQQLVEVDV